MSMRAISRAAAAFAVAVLGNASVALAQAPSVGPNVNMVQGTKWPQGDPFLTKPLDQPCNKDTVTTRPYFIVNSTHDAPSDTPPTKSLLPFS